MTVSMNFQTNVAIHLLLLIRKYYLFICKYKQIKKLVNSRFNVIFMSFRFDLYKNSDFPQNI